MLLKALTQRKNRMVKNKEVRRMKDGIHGNREQVEELSAGRILSELYDKAKAENDGKVHIREIKNGHVGKTIEKYL